MDEKREKQCKRVKKAIKEHGLTQREMSEKLNYTEQYVSNISTGKKAVTEEFAERLCDVLNSLHTPRLHIDENGLKEIAAENGITEEEAKEIMLEFDNADSYEPAYFLAEMDEKNSILQSRTQWNSEGEFFNAVRTLLHALGYEIIDKEVNNTDALIFSPRGLNIDTFLFSSRKLKQDTIGIMKALTYGNDKKMNKKEFNKEVRNWFLDDTFLTVKERKTGEVIGISRIEYSAIMNTVCTVIDQQLQMASMRSHILHPSVYGKTDKHEKQ